MMGRNAKSGREHRGWIAVIFCAVLLASTAAAWLITQRTHVARANALKILQDIRQNGLAHYWAADKKQAYYIDYNQGGEALSWYVQARNPISGGFSGIEVIGGKNQIIEAQWTLDDHGQTGRYRSQALPENVLTHIVLDKGRVGVVRQILHKRIEGNSPAPQNYIPEGMMDLAAYQTLRSGEKARFVTIFDTHAFDANGRLRFGSTTFEPLDAHRVRQTIEIAGAEASSVLTFSDEGDLKEANKDSGALVRKQVSLEELTSKFPRLPGELGIDVQKTDDSPASKEPI